MSYRPPATPAHHHPELEACPDRMAQRSKPTCETVNTISSFTTRASHQRPVPAWSSRRRHISELSRTERFGMLLQRRPLRVQVARSSNLPDDKYHRASTSQAQFELEVPKWSAYFDSDTTRNVSTTPSAEKNICPDGMAQRSKPTCETVNTTSSFTTRASHQRPVPAWSSRRRHISQLSRTERFGMLLPRRPLRVQVARSSNLPDDKYHRAPTSQAQFELEVPKWSAYFASDTTRNVSTTPSAEKNICSVQIQTADRSLPADPSRKSHTETDEVKKLLPAQPVRRIVRAKYRLHDAPTSQKSRTDRREETRPVPTHRSAPDDSSLFEGPSAKRQHINTSQQFTSEKMKPKRPFRPVVQPKQTQTQFIIEVPNWSVYFSPESSSDVSVKPPVPSEEKNICSVQSEKALPVQSAHRIVRTKYRLHDPPTSQQFTSEEMKQKRPFHPYVRPQQKSRVAPQSQTRFVIEVPNWSVSGTPSLPSEEKNICSVRSEKALPVQSAHRIVRTKYRLHDPPTSQQFTSEEMKQKRPFHPYVRPQQKSRVAPQSQTRFVIEVPNWSVSGTPSLPSEEKNIYSVQSEKALPVQSARRIVRTNYRCHDAPTSQQSHPDAPDKTRVKENRFGVSDTRDESAAQSSSQVQPAPAQTLCKTSNTQRSLFCREKEKWCVAPVIVSDKFSRLDDIPRESPVPSTLVIGDSILRHVKVEKQATVVNCLPGARASHISAKLKALANAKRTFKRIVIHVGTNDVNSRESAFAEDNIVELCEYAKTLSDTVVFSGPLPGYRSQEKYHRLMSLHDWMSDWCPRHHVGFINNWKCFWRRRELIGRDGLHPSHGGATVFSKNLTNNLPRV